MTFLQSYINNQGRFSLEDRFPPEFRQCIYRYQHMYHKQPLQKQEQQRLQGQEGTLMSLESPLQSSIIAVTYVCRETRDCLKDVILCISLAERFIEGFFGVTCAGSARGLILDEIKNGRRPLQDENRSEGNSTEESKNRKQYRLKEVHR
jgi:hypothetical protein